MMIKMNTTHQLFNPAKVEEVAAEMQAGDDEGWTYRVKHAPTSTGYSFIEIYDENGEFVEKF